jgi:cytochrome b561
MSENEVWFLYPIHKSVGTIIFVFILLRVINRIKEGWLEPVSVYKSWEIALSNIIHWVLLLGTLMFPISGLIMSGASGNGIYVFGLELLASNYNAAGEAIALNASVAELGHEIHEILPWILIPSIVLHIAGAWKHHLVDKDATLKRLIGKS